MIQWNLIYVIVSIILIIVGLFGYYLTQNQNLSECDKLIVQLNKEGDKLEKESKIINERINKYNRELSSYKRDLFSNSSYTQQLVNTESDLEQKSLILGEKINLHNNKAQLFKVKCNLDIEYR